MNSSSGPSFSQHNTFLVKQRHELAEWFGFETRNKYEVVSSKGESLAYAAEQGRGFFGLMFRQVLGHWRTFELHFFTPDRQKFMAAVHPFRWYFQELEVYDGQSKRIGRVVKRFSIFSKCFEVRNHLDQVIMEVASPIWKIWSFAFVRNKVQVATVKKKWSGIFLEALTDKDTFAVEVQDPSLSEDVRRLLLASSLYIDLMYFERKANN